MSDAVFVDTNILVYMHDENAGIKHEEAKSVIDHLIDSDYEPTISIQVLQELHVNLLRKGVAFDESRRLVHTYAKWRMVQNDTNTLFNALDIQKYYSISFWDALIIAAALCAECRELWTEDLQDGQCFGNLTVRNPLLL